MVGTPSSRWGSVGAPFPACRRTPYSRQMRERCGGGQGRGWEWRRTDQCGRRRLVFAPPFQLHLVTHSSVGGHLYGHQCTAQHTQCVGALVHDESHVERLVAPYAGLAAYRDA